MKKIGIFVLLLTILMGSTSCHNHVSSDGTVTESESNSLAVTEPVTESVAPEPDLTNAIHMFKDPSFKMGMYHTGIKNSLTAGRFDHALTVPQWLYTQEGSKHNLAEEGVYSNPAEGVHVYEDTSKLLYLDTNTGMFRLDFRASREYTAPKISAGSLVTPTMIRDIYVTEMEHLYVTLDFTLNEVTNYMSDEDFDVHQHTIQWDFYMFFQDSKSHQWFYLGLPLYDIRGTGKTTYIAGDAGTGGTMVYIPSYKKAYGEGVKVEVGKRFTQTVDMMTLVEEAFKTGIAKGYLKGCKLEDFYVSGCNLGWEVSGNMDGAATVYEFSAKYVPKYDK